jgi:adenosylcobinamide-GDP ribazoletransferase
MLMGLRRAITFLTRLPVPARTERSADLATALPWFGVVGALVGAAVGGMYALVRLALPPFPAAVIAIAASALITGGFHEDGLGDVADAFGGGHDRESVARILRDSRQGTFGVLAICAAFLARVALVGSIPDAQAWLALGAAGALSRGFAVAAMWLAPAAEGSTLGASAGAAARPIQFASGVTIATLIAAAALGWWTLVAIVLGVVVSVALVVLAIRKLGGVNGDVLGAIQQLTEIATLAVVVAVITHGWARAGLRVHP